MKWIIRFTFLALAWVGAFGIAFGVHEWRESGASSASVSTDTHAEWVVCISAINVDPGFFAETDILTEPFVQGSIERCDPENRGMDRLWVFCINEEIGRGDPDIAMGVREAQDIARSCEAQLD